jgi:hypothetical protein
MPERVTHAAESHTTGQRLPLRAAVIAWAFILAISLLSLYFFYSRGLSNLYGDGIAHMEGARRIFDSLTPGYAEIGTVWLPLYHLLVAPLALNDFLWRTGLGGSLVSTAAFALAAWYLFRMGFEMNGSQSAAAVALAGFLLCPNMLYLASTPLTEPLAFLWMVLVVYGLFRYQQEGRIRPLIASAAAAFLGTLTRYDGWFLLPFAALYILAASPHHWKTRLRDALVFSAIAGTGPVLWFLHNAIRFGNPLEFYNGPFSAQAIYARQLATSGFAYPTDGSLLLSARYYLADLDLVIGAWPLELAVLGLVAWAVDRRRRLRRSAALLFLVPFPFYIQSMAHAAVPLYVPTLFPNTYYNLRYGLEMLPAVALLPSFLLVSGLSRRVRAALTVMLLAAIVGQGISIASHGARELAVAKEGVLNCPCHAKLQEALIQFLKDRYDGQRIVMASGKWLCLMPEVGIDYRNTLTEANRKYWAEMRWQPEKWVGWIIRGDGDSVDALMLAYPQAFKDFDLRFHASFPGEGSVAVYRRRGR